MFRFSMGHDYPSDIVGEEGNCPTMFSQFLKDQTNIYRVRFYSNNIHGGLGGRVR